jgi:hypothetical protein
LNWNEKVEGMVDNGTKSKNHKKIIKEMHTIGRREAHRNSTRFSSSKDSFSLLQLRSKASTKNPDGQKKIQNELNNTLSKLLACA